MQRFITEFRKVPGRVKVLSGTHKGLEGHVWLTHGEEIEIETDYGLYLTEPLENTEILSFTRRKLIADQTGKL